MFSFLSENSLHINSNVPGDLIGKNDTIKYTCDVRYAGNIRPTMVWTAASNPYREIPHSEQNSPGIAKTVIQIRGNDRTNGEKYVCKLFFIAPLSTKTNVASNDLDCFPSRVSIPLTVRGRYFVQLYTKHNYLNHM